LNKINSCLEASIKVLLNILYEDVMVPISDKIPPAKTGPIPGIEIRD
jgi:hypothetical protein